MKNSTIIGISVLAVAGASFYFYSKGKKSTTTNSTVPTSTTPTDDTKLLQDLGVTITPTTPTPYVKPVEGVPLLTSENIQKALLALGIDQTRGISELASPNYIQAKKLASDIQYLSSYKFKMGGNSGYGYTDDEIKMLTSYYGSNVEATRFGCNKGNPPCNYTSRVSPQDIIKSMTQRINALGYKLLPNFEIEKM